jgi:acetyltransferase-like isoleucine patch superfamily enzyme
MRKVVLFGDTMLTKEVFNYLKGFPEEYEIIGTTLDGEYINKTNVSGLVQYDFEKLGDILDMNEVEILPTIGYVNMNIPREKLFNRIREMGYKIGSYIDPRSIMYASQLGEGNIILGECYLGPEVKIGEGNIIKHGTYIDHDTNVGNFNFFAVSSVAGDVKIGNNNLLGFRSLIKDSIRIGNHNLIGIGSCLKTDLDNWCIVSEKESKRIQANERVISTYL